jgi:hypothetical protein
VVSIDRDLDPASFSRAVIRDDTDFDYVLAGGGIGGKIVFTGAEKKLVSEGDICVGEFSRFFHFISFFSERSDYLVAQYLITLNHLTPSVNTFVT